MFTETWRRLLKVCHRLPSGSTSWALCQFIRMRHPHVQESFPSFRLHADSVKAPRLSLLLHVELSTYQHLKIAVVMFDSLLTGPDSHIWINSLANEIGRCAVGMSKSCKSHGKISGNNTVYFSEPSQLPPNCKITYPNFVWTIRPSKNEIHRVRMTVRGKRFDAYQDIRSPFVGTLDIKIYSTVFFQMHTNVHAAAQLTIRTFFYVLLCRFICTCTFIVAIFHLKWSSTSLLSDMQTNVWIDTNSYLRMSATACSSVPLWICPM